MLPALDVRDAITIITAIVTITSVILTQRAGISKLTDGQEALKAAQAEGLRQLQAVHKRMDEFMEKHTGLSEKHARLDERVKALKESQRFKMAGKQDMFAEDDQG